jgi:EAL domain-containing protein (putative c-di-GMP-specific phosphodiesterase class I)
LESRMRGALARNEFFLMYQPKVDLPSGKIVGAEALVRWQDPEHGLISPGQFIPVAEDSGLIIALGKWILAEVCRQNRAWQDAGYPPQVIAVNVSPVQFVRKEFLSEIQAVLRESGMDARHLELELTETALLRDLDRTANALIALRQLGVSVSLDDFGTGYSSLTYLKRFPIDTIKVDQSFVRDIIDDPDDAAIVSAVIGMAKSLKRTVVAEGVETAEQLHWLRAHGCDQMQGYYFSKPVSAQDFTQRFFRGNLMKTLSMEWLGHFR